MFCRESYHAPCVGWIKKMRVLWQFHPQRGKSLGSGANMGSHEDEAKNQPDGMHQTWHRAVPYSKSGGGNPYDLNSLVWSEGRNGGWAQQRDNGWSVSKINENQGQRRNGVAFHPHPPLFTGSLIQFLDLNLFLTSA